MKHPKRVALLIDGDNVSATHAAAILAIAKSHGDVIFSRAYVNAGQGNGDWSKRNIDVLITGMGASVSDFRLSFEAVEMDVRASHDVFIIASNDTDLIHVVRWLTQRGRTVVLAGTTHMGKELRNSGAEIHLLGGTSAGKKVKKTESLPEVILATAEPEPVDALTPEAPEASARNSEPKIALAAGQPDPEAMAALIRSVLAQHDGQMLMTAFGNLMRKVYGVQPKHGGQRTWKRYLDTQKDKFLLTGPETALVLSLRPKAEYTDPETGDNIRKDENDV